MIASIAYILLAIVVFFFLLSFLIFFHELGHYSVGRLFGIRVERFSIGFGKPILRRRAKSGTEWALSRIPLGGYVKFYGDASAASNPDEDALEAIRAAHDDVSDIFHFKPVWQRALVILAGPVFNFILAAVLFGLAFMWAGRTVVAPVIGLVEAGTPAAIGGLQPGDRVLTMNGKTIDTWPAMTQEIALSADTPIDMTVERDNRTVSLTVTPERREDRDFVGGRITKGYFGVALDQEQAVSVQRYGPVAALGEGVGEVGNTLSATTRYLGRIFTGREDGKQFGSILRIGVMTGKSTTDIAQLDRPAGERLRALMLRLLTLGAAISVALGFANLLPIPVLDGGHLLFYGYEAVAGKPLPIPIQEMGLRFGFAVLIGLFVVLTINDIGYIQSFFQQG